MRDLKWIVRGILAFGYAGAASAQSIQTAACLRAVCQPSAGVTSAKDFIRREDTDHPGLEAFLDLYRARIEAIRRGRQALAADALATLRDVAGIENQIRQMPAADLLTMLLDLHPWNTKTDLADGEYRVVAEPLVGSDKTDQHALLRDLFQRFQNASPLYRANLYAGQLNREPRAVLSLDANVTVESHITNRLNQLLARLSPETRAKFESEISRLRAKLEPMRKQYGDRVALVQGEFELKIEIALGTVPLTAAERTLLETIMTERLTDQASGRGGEIDLVKAYDPQAWARTCRQASNRALHYAPTETEARDFERLKTDAFHRAHATLIELFGDALAARILEHLKTMNIGGPMTLAEYRTFTEGYLRAQEELIARGEMSLVEKFDFTRELGRGTDRTVESLCNGWIFEPVRDQVSGRSIILSSYSVKNYEVGLAIAIHELGHAASAALKFLSTKGTDIGRFEKIRQCLSENYVTQNRPGTYPQCLPTDKLWTEEDWADAFSGHAVRDLTVNEMCPFLGAAPNFDFVSLVNRSADEHSPTFYRILNIHAHMGRPLGPQCQAALAAEFPGTAFSNCFPN